MKLRIEKWVEDTKPFSAPVNELFTEAVNNYKLIEDGGLTVYKVKADMDIAKNKKVSLFTRVKTVFTNLAHKEK